MANCFEYILEPVQAKRPAQVLFISGPQPLSSGALNDKMSGNRLKIKNATVG